MATLIDNVALTTVGTESANFTVSENSSTFEINSTGAVGGRMFLKASTDAGATFVEHEVPQVPFNGTQAFAFTLEGFNSATIFRVFVSGMAGNVTVKNS